MSEQGVVELGFAPSATAVEPEPTALLDLRFEGKPVSVSVDADGALWFAAPEVCRVLEMADVSSALRVLDADEKGPLTVRTLGGPQIVSAISEPGLYKLMARSRKPEAKRFDRWVRHEVLPAIRKTGGYIVAAPDETPEELTLRAMKVLQATVDRQKADIAALAPKADALDRIATADGSLNVTDAAKALQVRPKDLFDFLKTNGWIYRRNGTDHWLGYQTRTSAGDLEHKVHTVLLPDGSEKVRESVRVTPRGLTKLAKLMPGRLSVVQAA